MKVETLVDATRADQLLTDLRRVTRYAEPALEDEELQTLSEVADWIENTACIETGECIKESPTTEKTYRVTRWIDAGDGQVIALSKEEIDDPEAEA